MIVATDVYQELAFSSSMQKYIGPSIRVSCAAVATSLLVSCSARKEPEATIDTSSVAAQEERLPATWTDVELFAFMSVNFRDLSIEGVEMARRSRNTELRKLGRSVSYEFGPLAARSDSLARELGFTSTHRRQNSGLSPGSSSRRSALPTTTRDVQLVRHLESSLSVALEQLDDARVPGRRLEVNLLLDSGRSALWRSLDKTRLARERIGRRVTTP
jgi:hypothetical protein